MNTFVTDPISNTVSLAVQRVRIILREASVRDQPAALRLEDPDDDAEALLVGINPLDQDAANLVVRRDRGNGC